MAKKSNIAIDIEADARKAEQLKREGERRRSLAKSKKITEETRQASYITRPTARKEAVLEALGEESLTARQHGASTAHGADGCRRGRGLWQGA